MFHWMKRTFAYGSAIAVKSFDYFVRLASELASDNPLIHGTFL